MAIDTTEVRVAGAGHVYVAPEGTDLPIDVDTELTDEWVDLGYVTTDGVTFTYGRETEDLDAWQGDKIRVLSSREPMTVAYSLMQTSADVMVVAMGGGEIVDNGGTYVYTPETGVNLVRAQVIEFDDGGIIYRYCIPKSQIEGDVSYTLTREGALTYPLTFGVLDDTPKYQIISNDPAMATGTLPGTPDPAPFDPTGVEAGTPGQFTPDGCTIPADLAYLQSLGTLGETTAWVTGEYVVLGDLSNAYFDGAGWLDGIAP